MNEQQILRCAKKIVTEVCQIKTDEKILIVTNRSLKNGIAETEIISQALYDECIKVGAKSVMIVQSEKTALDAADSVVIAALKTEPDVFFSISANKLGKDLEAIKKPYVAEDGSTHDHIFDYLLYGKKTMRAVWTPGITLDMFARTVDIDYQLLGDRCRKLCELYKDVQTVRVTSPLGTDVVVPVAGRRAFEDNGFFCVAGSGGNIPAGEVFISPLVGDGKEKGCKGTIVFDGSITVNEGDFLLENPVTIDVKGGFVQSVKGGIEATKLLDTITTAEKSALQMENEGKLPSGQGIVYSRNARNIGELGIGLNPSATITGNMLEDEKAFRTCHFAIGANYDGDAPALIHLDCVVKNPTIEFTYSDGSTRIVLRAGELVE
ncbi:MAG: peptidase M17 [Spirochaetaceae bacterium]|nr:peptidase M17 [Spirochaetaceae bacterium]